MTKQKRTRKNAKIIVRNITRKTPKGGAIHTRRDKGKEKGK